MAKEYKKTTGIKDGKLHCYNCGESQSIPLPMDLRLAADFFKSFHNIHKNHKPSDAPF